MADVTRVEPMDPDKKNSPIAGPVEDESTVMLDKAATQCFWNDQVFEEGALVEDAGSRYECSLGQWIKSE